MSGTSGLPKVASDYAVLAASRFYRGQGGIMSSSATLVVAANLIYAMPIIWRGGLVASINSNVTTATVGNLRNGIYNHDPVGKYPSVLVFGGGTASTGTTGIKSTTVNQNLPPGLYWLCVQFSAAPTMRAMADVTRFGQLNFGSSINNPTTSADLAIGLSAAFTFAAFPTMFPGTPTYRNASTLPMVQLGT